MGKFVDITGQRFGRLIVLKRVENNKHGKAQWLCQCDCGNTIKATTGSLNSGNTKSCGCFQKEKVKSYIGKNSPNFVDITNKRFGKLVAIEYLETDKKWLCKCDCGNTVKVSIKSLNGGHTSSCGCLYAKDLLGGRFGRLLVLKRLGSNKHQKALWLCRCDCGNETIVAGTELLKGNTKSCGCLHFEQMYSKFNTKHGKSGHKLHGIWSAMKNRCCNPNDKGYVRYGGRGIKVCEEWKSDFMNFYNWAVNNGYQEGLTIDRINNNSNYEPDNCRWTTTSVQNRNTRRNVLLTYKGRTQCLIDWAQELKINYWVLKYKLIEKGLTLEDIIGDNTNE